MKLFLEGGDAAGQLSGATPHRLMFKGTAPILTFWIIVFVKFQYVIPLVVLLAFMVLYEIFGT